MRTWLLIFLLSVLLAGLPVAGAQELDNESCIECHDDFEDDEEFTASVHGKLSCIECHKGIKEIPHPDTLPKVSCTSCHEESAAKFADSVHAKMAGKKGAAKPPSCADCHGTHHMGKATRALAKSCDACHGDVAKTWATSVHGGVGGNGSVLAANCIDCHGGHSIYAKEDIRSPVHHLQLPHTCGKCHGDDEVAKKANISRPAAYRHYLDSIHGQYIAKGLLVAADCGECHGSHDIRPHDDPASRVHRSNIPETCGKCHLGIQRDLERSVHSRRDDPSKKYPVCTDCHTTHEIAGVHNGDWKLQSLEGCGSCHAEYLETYKDTYHGKVTNLGYATVASCSDCHGAHRVLPASNPESMLAPNNIVETCKTCHPGATENYATYKPHANHRDPDRYPFLFAADFSMRILLFGVFSFFGLHTALWLFRELRERRRAA